MSAIRPATRQDLPQIVSLLRNANDTPYDASKVAEEKCFGMGMGGAPRSLVAISGEEIVGVAVSCGAALRLIAVDRKLRRKGIGTVLLHEAEKNIEGKLIDVGSEPGNYFLPGIPAEDQGMRRFFHRNGYENDDEAVDLEVDLSRVPAPGLGVVSRAAFHERDEVLDFVEQRFARSWRLEAERAFEHEQPTLFVARQDARLVGFSAHDANNRGLGFFGPEGVLPEARGRGLGRLLLLASLDDLRRMGFERTIIAWAAAHDFYRRVAGAVVAHTFLIMRKKL